MRLKSFRSVAIILILLFFSMNLFATEMEQNMGGVDDEDVENKLSQISEEEKIILEDLFLKKQEIDALKIEEEKINESIKESEKKIKELETSLRFAEAGYEKQKELIKDVLIVYQKNGSVNYFKMLFSSDSISDMLFKMNIFREFTQNTENLLSNIKVEQQNIISKKNELDSILKEQLRQKDELRVVIEKTENAIKINEDALNSLAGDRLKYEERLKIIDETMSEFELTLQTFTDEFNKLISNSYFPDDIIKQDISLKGIRAIVEEKNFNKLLNEKDIPKIEILFKDNNIEIISEEYNLKLVGNFEVVDETKLKFIGESGSFYDMKLEDSTINNLMEKGYLLLDFKPLLQNNKIKKVEAREGFLDIYLNIKLF